MRIRSLTSCAVMLLVLIVGFHVRGEYIDIENESLGNEISVLEQLGILSGYDDAVYRPDEAVLRGEFAIYAAKLLAIEPVEGNSIFTDVEPDSDYYRYVNSLAAAGIISGTEDNFYNPEREITYPEAVKIILSGMGYDAICELEGGWPEGYLKEASKQKLGTASSGSLTRAGLARLFYDSLTAPIMEPHETVGTNIKYKESDETLMKKLHNLYLIDGIMSYNGSVSIDGREKSVLSYIIVDNVRIELDGRDCSEYIGCHVLAFAYNADEKSSDFTLRAIVPKAGKNKIVTVDAENIDEVSGGELVHAERGRKTVKYRFKDAALIYNGSYRAEYDDDLLMPKEGFIRLVDNDNDNIYEVVIVYDITDDVISGINSSSETVYLQNLGYVELRDKKVDIFVNGKRRSLADLSAECAVSVAIGDDDHITLWVSTERTSGVLSVLGEDYIDIGEATYPTSAYFDSDDIRVGSIYTVYISSFGKAVKLKSMSKDEHYGYLIGISYANEDYIDDDIKFRILTDDGGILKLEPSENVSIDGKRLRLEMNSFQQYGLLDSNGKGIQQLLKYTLDTDGRLLRLYTPKDMTAYGICEEEFSLDRHVENTSTRFYKYNIGINYHIGAATKLFYLPLANETARSDSDYRAGTLGTFSQDIYYSNFDIYDTRPDRTAGVVVIRRTIRPQLVSDKLTDSLMKRNLGVITKCRAVYAEDEVSTEITMLTSGREIVLYTQEHDLSNSTQDAWNYPQITADELSKGDIILYSTNEVGEISDYTILFRGTELKGKIFKECVPSNISIDENNEVALTPLHTVFGEVCAVNGRTYSINMSHPQNDRPSDKEMRHIVATAASQVYIMNYDESKMYAGELSEISEGDIVFMRLYNYVPQQIVVFRGEQR